MKLVLALTLAMTSTAAVAQEPLSLALTCTGIVVDDDEVKTRTTVRDQEDFTKRRTVESNTTIHRELEAKLSVILENGTGKIRPEVRGRNLAAGDGWQPLNNLILNDK